MKSPALAVFLVALMATSGCIGLADDGKMNKLVEIDLGDITKRSIGSPDLEIYSDCLELETALKISIEEEAENQPLQAVEEHILGWRNLDGRFAEMAMDDGGSATSSPPPPQERKVLIIQGQIIRNRV